MKLLNPGSLEAKVAGCTCAVLDNAHGKGIHGDGERYGWWVSADCPMHAKPSDPADEEDGT